MTHRYEIDSNNAIRCFAEGSTIPHLYQPHWPNGDAWANADEAKNWADLFLASEDDISAPLAPVSRDVSGITRWTTEQNIAIQKVRVLFDAATTKEQKQEIVQSKGPELARTLGLDSSAVDKMMEVL